MTDALTQLRAELRAGIPYAGETDSGGEMYDFDAAETTMALAADALDALQAERDELDFLLHEGGTMEAQLSKAESERDEARARVTALEKGLNELANAISDNLTENGLPHHRIKLTDGTWLEGKAATDWRNMLVAFRDYARALLNPSKGSAG